MGYAQALAKAWDDAAAAGINGTRRVRFLGDEYELDCAARRVLSLSCNVPAKEFTAIIILHYCTAVSRGVPACTGVWADFRELAGIEGYESAFRARVIAPLVRKYGAHPQGLREAAGRFGARESAQGDVGVIIDAAEGIPVQIMLWKGDDEFPPDANVLFDRSVTKILCTEDIIVLAETLSRIL